MHELLDIKSDGSATVVPPVEPEPFGFVPVRWTSGRKGFITPPALRKERDAARREGAGFEWAVMHKPGANVINGGRKRAYAEHHRELYRRFAKDQRRRNPRFKLGRYTRPIPHVAS